MGRRRHCSSILTRSCHNENGARGGGCAWRGGTVAGGGPPGASCLYAIEVGGQARQLRPADPGAVAAAHTSARKASVARRPRPQAPARWAGSGTAVRRARQPPLPSSSTEWSGPDQSQGERCVEQMLATLLSRRPRAACALVQPRTRLSRSGCSARSSGVAQLRVGSLLVEPRLQRTTWPFWPFWPLRMSASSTPQPDRPRSEKRRGGPNCCVSTRCWSTQICTEQPCRWWPRAATAAWYLSCRSVATCCRCVQDVDLTPLGLARLLIAVLDTLGLERSRRWSRHRGALTQLLIANHRDRVGRVVLTACDACEHLPPKTMIGRGVHPAASADRARHRSSHRLRRLFRHRPARRARRIDRRSPVPAKGCAEPREPLRRGAGRGETSVVRRVRSEDRSHVWVYRDR